MNSLTRLIQSVKSRKNLSNQFIIFKKNIEHWIIQSVLYSNKEHNRYYIVVLQQSFIDRREITKEEQINQRQKKNI